MATAVVEDVGLSVEQRRLAASAGTAPLTHMTVRVEGEVDRDALAAGAARLVREHSALRTLYPVPPGGELPVQRVVPDLPPVWDPEARPDAVQGPALACALSPGRDGHPRLRLSAPVLSADAASMGVLLHDLALFCGGGEREWEPLDYADYVAWHRRILEEPEAEEGRRFWRRQTRQAPDAALPFPTADGAPAGVRPVPLPAGTAAAVAELAAAAGVAPSAVMAAAWRSLLGRLAGVPEVVVHHVLEGREQEELADAVGLYARCLPVRGRCDRHLSFSELLDLVAADLAAARDWQDHGRLDAGAEPRFGFQAHRLPAPVEAAGMRFMAEELECPVVDFGVALVVEEREAGDLAARLRWRAGELAAADGGGLAHAFASLLAAATSDPGSRLGELDLLGPAQRHLLLVERNAQPAVPAGAADLLEPFRRTVAERPDEPALECAGEGLTFGELGGRVHRLAHRLQRMGVGPDVPVALLFEREPDLPAALLAVLQAGGAAVPLDPDHPAARLRTVLEISGARVVVSRAGLDERLQELPEGVELLRLDGDPPERGPVAPPPCAAGPDHLAYVLFTSGSTGAPKGVMVTRRAVAALRDGLEAWVYRPRGGAETVACNAPFTFDASVQQWLQLVAGRTLVLLTADERLDPERMLARLRRSGVEVLDTTPSHLRPLLEAGWLSDDRDAGSVLVGGEAVDPELWRGLAEGAVEAFNVYGPTECTVDATIRRIDGERPSLGVPLPGVRLYVLDDELRPVPPGVPGELCLAGIGLARGYRRQPALTAAAFVPDPFAALHGGSGTRLYRTGDRVRWLRDGELEFLGRTDHQVKLRGHRIELAEIERHLVALSGVRDAAVVVAGGPGQPERLVGYLTLAAGVERDGLEERLLAELARTLPDYMLPSVLQVLPEFPLTPHGKLDRRALPEPGDAGGEGTYVPPRTPAEEVLAEIWGEVLGLARVGRHADFFALGGHSLLAVQVVSRVRAALGVELPVRLMFDAPILDRLAAAVERQRRREAVGEAPPLVPASREGDLPLSYAQERLWFLDRLDPGNAAYNVTGGYRFEGPLAVPALAAALAEVVRRHEVLRTSFGEVDGVPVQRVAPLRPLRLPVADLSALRAEDRENEARRLVGRLFAAPFHLARGPLLRASLLRLGDADHAIALALHHTVSDGWSMNLLRRETGALYEAFSGGRPSPLASLALQYADYAAWQRDWLRGGVLAGQLDFWRHQLAGAPPRLELPTDRPRPPVQSHRGGTLSWPAPQGLGERVREAGRSRGATPFMVLLTAFAALLARWSGQRDLVVGTPVAGRNRLEIEPLIGLFANTLALRAELAPAESFAGLLGQLRERVLDAHAHQDLPFEKLVEELEPERSLDRSPLFQVMFLHQPDGEGSPGEARMGEVRTRALGEEAGGAAFDLTLATFGGEALAGGVEYNADLFDRTTVERMGRHFRTLLDAALDAPERPLLDLPWLAASERQQVVEEWPRGPLPVPGDDLLAAVAAQAGERPGDPAVVTRGGGSVTYAELWRSSRRLARHLSELGVGPEVGVALHLGRSPRRIEAMLAVLAAGGFFVPVDGSWPSRRRRHVLADSGARLVLTEGRLAAGLEERDELEDAGVQVLAVEDLAGSERGEGSAETPWRGAPGGAENLAYVLYTSGSSGRPKGVGVPRRALDGFVRAAAELYALGPRDRVLQFASPGFDTTVEEIFPVLTRGGCTLLRDDAMLSSVAGFLAACGEAGATVLDLPTAYWHELVLELAGGEIPWPGSVRTVILGGERMVPERWRQWRRAAVPAELWNTYGPTEATVVSSAARLPQSPAGTSGPTPASRGVAPEASIGRPLPGVRLHVVDRRLEPVPPGAPGELLIGGGALARGYLGDPRRTAAAFVPDPFGGEPGARLYRSGDRVRWRADGELEFLGRLDRQVKVRGFRIEPGEVESVLAAHPGVAQVVVDVRGASLVAWITVPEGAEVPRGDDLRQWSRRRLPAYMVPSRSVVLEEMPLTPSGKLDRHALPEPAAAAEVEHEPPSGPVEELLAELWRELLDVERVGAGDDFFLLGGHSLLATRVVSRVRSELGVDLPVRRIFETPTLRGVAAAVEEARPIDARAGSPLVDLRDAGAEPPLFLVHAVLGTVVPYLPLVRSLPPRYPVHGLRALGLEAGERPAPDLDAMADAYLEEVRQVRPEGPYRLAGWSVGGLVALEMARRLRRRGTAVEAVVLVDTHLPEPEEVAAAGELEHLAAFGRHLELPLDHLAVHRRDLEGLERGELLRRLASRAAETGLLPVGVEVEEMERLYAVFRNNLHVIESREVAPYDGPVTLLWGRDRDGGGEIVDGWKALVGGLHVEPVPGDHFTMIREPHVADLAEALDRALVAPGAGGGGDPEGDPT